VFSIVDTCIKAFFFFCLCVNVRYKGKVKTKWNEPWSSYSFAVLRKPLCTSFIECVYSTLLYSPFFSWQRLL